MSTVVISGASRGIGLELARQLSERGERVIALCRESNAALDDLGVQVVENADVTRDESLQAIAENLAGERIDLLINNAGILQRNPLDQLDYDSMRRQFEVNSLGPLRLTTTLLPNLNEGAKVGIVTSRMGSIEDNTSGGHYGYRASKAAANMIGVSLARDLEPRGIAVALLHPGMVATDMTGKQGIPVEEAASGLIARLDELDLSNSGRFWHANGEALPW